MVRNNMFQNPPVPSSPPVSSMPVPSTSTSTSSKPSPSPSPPPSTIPLPTIEPTATNAYRVHHQLGEMWYVIFIPVLCIVLSFMLREYYHYQERNDPNSSYSRRRRERELLQLRRAWMQTLIERGDAGRGNDIGQRRRRRRRRRRNRRRNVEWMSPARMEEKKNYILNNICVEMYKNGYQNDIEKNHQNHNEALDEHMSERSISNTNNGNNIAIVNIVQEVQEVISTVMVDFNLLTSASTRTNTSTNTNSRPTSSTCRRTCSRPKSSNSITSIESNRRDVCAICIENFIHGDAICKSNYFVNNNDDNNDNDDNDGQTQKLEQSDIFDENTTAAPYACGHTFHVDCMIEWLMNPRSKGLCPLCRYPFLSMEEFDNQDRLRFMNNNNDRRDGENGDGNDGADGSANGNDSPSNSENVNRTTPSNEENNNNDPASFNLTIGNGNNGE